jgi:hypothetical protein
MLKENSIPLNKLARSLSKLLLDLHKKHFGQNNSFAITSNVRKTCPFPFNFEAYSNDDYESRWAYIIDLRDATNAEWKRIEQTGDIEKLASLAFWMVSDTGGISGNAEETILKYTEMAAAYGFVENNKGISSYSKILAAKDRTKYQIFDTRVAAALNIMQLSYFGGRKFYFDVDGARNNDVKDFDKLFPKRSFLMIGYKNIKRELSISDYKYYSLLVDRMAYYARREAIEIEMMLFDYCLNLVYDLKHIENKFVENINKIKAKDAYWKSRGVNKTPKQLLQILRDEV